MPANRLFAYGNGESSSALAATSTVIGKSWSFSTACQYIEPKEAPAGTKIELTVVWDNSADNPRNPDPSKDVVFELPSTSEMMFGFTNYVDKEPSYDPAGVQIFDKIAEAW